MKSASGPPALRTREKLPAPPQQARSVEKRRKLMESARVLFGDKGFEATSIGEIASGAGTATGAFYIYFRSKRQLLVALMNELLQRLNQVNLNFDRGDTRGGKGNAVQTGLHRFVSSVFQVDLEYFGVIRAWQEAALTDAELGRMQTAIHEWTEARILRVFQSLQKSPHTRSRRDLSNFARMMDRHFWSLLAQGSKMSAKEVDREIITAADVIYHYLFRDRG